MSERLTGNGRRGRGWTPDGTDAAIAGRHAYDEYAELTPIFHALQRGGPHRPEPPARRDEVDDFRRDPLTAPIPVQAFAAAVTSPARPSTVPPARRGEPEAVARTRARRAQHALEPRREGGGRHHLMAGTFR